MRKPNKPKNGRLNLARKLVDDLVALGSQETEMIRQIQDLFPERRQISKIMADLIDTHLTEHDKLRRIVEDLITIY